MSEEQPQEPVRDRTWVDVQKKTFTRWANNFIKERNLKIQDIAVDLGTGIILINLLEVLSSKQFTKYNKNPKLKPQKLENVGFCLDFIHKQGIKLVGIGPEDILDGKLKLILGLIWTLILRFQIQRSGLEGKQELLEWVRKQVAPYGLKPNNFNLDWTDGKVLSALTDSLKPGVLDYNSLTGEHLKDVENAMDVAEKEYSIPKLMDAPDIVECPDELALMTYISLFRDWWLEDQRKRAAEIEAERQRKMKTADPAQCYAHGPGLSGGSTNNEAPFTIQSVNYFGDNLPFGGNEFIVDVSGPEHINCNINDNNDGTYSCHYTPTSPGDYKIAISLRGTPIKGSPYGPAKIVGPDATTSYASGPGVEGARANQAAPFKIHSVAKNGQPVKTGGDPFSVNVAGPNNCAVPCEIKDNKDGTYDCSYQPVQPGVYNVEVLLGSNPIKGSPYHPLIEAGHATNCWAEGPGLEGGKTGNNNPFTIHSVDNDGNPVVQGGDPFEVKISGPENIVPTILDKGDGTHDVNYGVETPGDYTIDVTLHGKPIKDSPFKIHFIPDASNTTASGPGVEGARVGQEAPFKIQSFASNGQPVKTGGDTFKVNAVGPDGNPLPCQIKDNHDGSYDCSYCPVTPGFHTVEVLLKDEHIKNSPFKPLMEAGNAGKSWAEGPGLVGGKTGRSNPFTIHSVDADGNPVNKGGDPFVVEINGPEPVTPTVVDNNNGTYSVDYKVETPANYTVNVTLHGQPIKDSPFNVLIKPDVDPSKCVAEGPGLHGSKDNEPTHFTIFAKDGDGNQKSEGGDPFEVKIVGPEEIVPKIVDNGDGTYLVNYAPNVPGDYTIFVTLEEQPIKDAPFAMQCLSGTDVEKSGFKTFTFTIQTRDKHGNNKNFGGDKFEVTAAGPSNVDVDTKDNGDGTYTASFAPTQRGTYTVTILFNGKQLSSSPLKLEF